MSPVMVYHSAYQAELSFLLRSFVKSGRALVECAIRTKKGTKVADVAWASDERFLKIIHETECPIAPEICIEVISFSNTEDEIEEKKRLYFKHGAEEVWICTSNGDISFYNSEKELHKSGLIPDFPKQVRLI